MSTSSGRCTGESLRIECHAAWAASAARRGVPPRFLRRPVAVFRPPWVFPPACGFVRGRARFFSVAGGSAAALYDRVWPALKPLGLLSYPFLGGGLAMGLGDL